MQITKPVAFFAAVMVTASLLAGVRMGFEGATAMPVSSASAHAPTATIRTIRAERGRAADPASAGGGTTMPYYSYGASLPTFLKD